MDERLLVSYNLADVEAADPLTGFAAEVDFRFGGLPISFVGHVSSTDPQSFTGAGLRITHDVGPAGGVRSLPVRVAQDGQRRDRRGGPEARRRGERPINERLFLRMGADHDGTAVYTVVGLGARW